MEAPKSEAELTIEKLIANAAAGTGKINNLNSLVKKKKQPTIVSVPDVPSSEKRKAEEDVDSPNKQPKI